MPNDKLNRLKGRVERLQVHKVSDTSYMVYNVSKGTKYNVTMDTKYGTWYCPCPFNTKGSRLREGNCKHLTLVLDKVNGCQVCGRNDKHADLKRESIVSAYLCATCRVTSI